MDQNLLNLHTFGELKKAGYKIKPVRIEMRDNLLIRLRNKERIMPGIIGYDETVLPEIENGVLAGHHMVFLGERGQAKSRIIRSLALFLDEYVPAIGNDITAVLMLGSEHERHKHGGIPGHFDGSENPLREALYRGNSH